MSLSRSREGAWIEICLRTLTALWLVVAPARERGLKFALCSCKIKLLDVAPARERGLK